MTETGTISIAGSVANNHSNVADGDLAKDVALVLEGARQRPVSVLSVRRRSCEFAALVPCEQVTATLADGKEVLLFVKHLSDVPSDQPDKNRGDRERLVYERLLSYKGLPAPRYYGTRRNDRTKRAAVYLECLADWSLKYHDVEHWFTAAARLAELHARFAARNAEEVRGCGFLLKLDEQYFGEWFGRACAALASHSPPLADRIETLTPDYGLAARLIAAQPATLVHNDLAPKNVIADRSAAPARICIVDWELAGVGCGLLDLVHLKYGLDVESDRRMVSVYRSQLSDTNLLPRDDHDFARLLAACELHKTVYRLAHSPAWKLPTARLEAWVADAEVFLKKVVQS